MINNLYVVTSELERRTISDPKVDIYIEAISTTDAIDKFRSFCIKQGLREYLSKIIQVRVTKLCKVDNIIK